MPPPAAAPAAAPASPGLDAESRMLQRQNQALDEVALAQRALAQGDYLSALRYASHSAQLYPGNPAALRIMAEAENFLGRHADAERDAKASNALKGTAAAYENQAWAEYRQGDLADALDSANRAVALNRNSALALAIRAAIEQALGRKWAAKRDIETAAEFDPAFRTRADRFAKGGLIVDAADTDMTFLSRVSAGGGESPAGKPAFPWRGAAEVLVAAFVVMLSALLVRRRRQSGSWRVALTPLPSVAVHERTPSGSVLVGKYKLNRVIGRGGMGVVYEAEDRTLGRTVAIKRMSDAAAGLGPAQRQKFLDEARTIASLHHPGIVDIYDVVEEGNSIFLVLEYAKGKTAFEVLTAEGRLPLRRALSILRPVCEALEYAHRKHFVHRDIKPDNIMVLDEGGAKLMDFGIARLLTGGDGRGGESRTHNVVGTPGYMAPESISGVVRKESDVYSLGVTLYELMAGTLPSDPPAPIADAPPALNELLAHAMARNPEERLQSAAEFLSRLEAIARRTRSTPS